MDSPKVSIIIPIYQADLFLKRCLDSISAQTMREIEIILVDDGSTDNSGKICDEYATKDNRIKVIHQSNQGVSVARQTGLDKALGEYIIHVDADDWIEEDEIETMYAFAKANNADMVISDFFIDNGHGSFVDFQQPADIRPHQIMIQLINQELFGCCWNKMIKKKIIDYYGITFSPNHIIFCEDLLFNCRLLNHDIKVSYLNKAFYHHNTYIHDNLTNSLSIKRLESRIFVTGELIKMINENEYECLNKQKKDILKEAFLLNKFTHYNQYYQDVQSQIIKETKNSSFYLYHYLSMAINGYPQIAYRLFKIRENISKLYRYYLKHEGSN